MTQLTNLYANLLLFNYEEIRIEVHVLSRSQAFNFPYSNFSL